MSQNENFLVIDFGAASIKLCEMELDSSGEMTMNVFAYREYEDELTDATRQGVLEGVLRQMIMESGCRAKRALISVSGQCALLRFGKITVQTRSRRQIKQMADFESRRNLPFELNEVTMDYQLLAGSADDQENHSIDVLSAVIKNSIVMQFIQAAQNIGITPLIVDLAPIACYNAARANGLGEDGCTLLISIGSRSTNLIFIEGDRFYARSIPIAGHSITQQLAKEFSITLPEAEELKRHHGYVAITDENSGFPETEDKSTSSNNVSRVIRNVFVRLYGEITRSINIYRAQQHGNPPTKIYLTGGSSTIPYCDRFFAERFKLPIEYFNPMRVLTLGEDIDRGRLAEIGHTFSENIGLAIRYAHNCPIEINLLPKAVQNQQMLRAKRHYLAVVLICFIGILCMIYSASTFATNEAKKRADSYAYEWNQVYKERYEDVTKAVKEAQQTLDKVNGIKAFLTERTIFPMLLEEIFRARPHKVWIDSITPIFGEVKAVETNSLVSDNNDNNNKGNNDSMDMMRNPMMGGGGPMGMDEMYSKDTTNILAGFIIQAHTIADDVVLSSDTAPLAKEPEYPFSLPEVTPASSEENSGGEDNEAKEKDKDKDKEVIDFSSENVFVRNLQSSRLFSNDPQMTALTKRNQNPQLKNGYDFEIQVKLDFEFNSHKFTFGTSGNSSQQMR